MTAALAPIGLVTSSEPIISANIYASGLLDDLLTSVIAPLCHEARSLIGERFKLWLIRHSRSGEHLKVRLHGDPQDKRLLEELLADRVHGYFDRVRVLPQASRRGARSDVPAIDPEEEAAIYPPDRSLLWTTYCRSAVTLASPWLNLEGFAEQSCNCMARACEWVLALHEAGASQLAVRRQKLLIQALLVGLPALGLCSADRAAEYLCYHRDWLLRFLFRDGARQEAALHQLSLEVHKRSATVDRIRRMSARSVPPADDPTDYASRFAATLRDLASYLAGIDGLIDRDADPFASDMTFPPVFKIMHNLANQCGVRPLEEAYVHHLLAAAIAPEMVES
jgi:hypothetical protein